MKMFSVKNKRAFTLIEMLTIVFIVGIVASLTLANYRGGQRRSDLITVAQNFASVFRRAQSMALSGHLEVTTGLPGYGYGVNITGAPTSTYRLFIDLNTSDSACPGGPSTCYRWDGTPTDELTQTFTLPTNFQVQSVPCADLSFSKPYGVVYCDGVALTVVSGDKTYTLVETKENKYLYVKVNSSGKIDVVSSL